MLQDIGHQTIKFESKCNRQHLSWVTEHHCQTLLTLSTTILRIFLVVPQTYSPSTLLPSSMPPGQANSLSSRLFTRSIYLGWEQFHCSLNNCKQLYLKEKGINWLWFGFMSPLVEKLVPWAVIWHIQFSFGFISSRTKQNNLLCNIINMQPCFSHTNTDILKSVVLAKCLTFKYFAICLLVFMSLGPFLSFLQQNCLTTN